LLSNEFSLAEYTKIDVGWGFAPDPIGRPRPYISRGPLRDRRGIEER